MTFHFVALRYLNQGLVSGGVLGEEGAVDDLAAVLALKRQQRLHQPLHHRSVAADAHLVVDGGDLGCAPGEHLDRMLRG